MKSYLSKNELKSFCLFDFIFIAFINMYIKFLYQRQVLNLFLVLLGKKILFCERLI